MAPAIVADELCCPSIARVMAPARLGKVVKCDDQLIWITLNLIDRMVYQFAVKSVKFSLGKDIFAPKGYTH